MHRLFSSSFNFFNYQLQKSYFFEKKVQMKSILQKRKSEYVPTYLLFGCSPQQVVGMYQQQKPLISCLIDYASRQYNTALIPSKTHCTIHLYHYLQCVFPNPRDHYYLPLFTKNKSSLGRLLRLSFSKIVTLTSLILLVKPFPLVYMKSNLKKSPKKSTCSYHES